MLQVHEQLRRIHKGLTGREIEARLRKLLDLPDQDDELRPIEPGLDLFVENNSGTTWDLLIFSSDVDGTHIDIAPYFADALESLCHISTELPSMGLEFLEVHEVTKVNVRVRIIINDKTVWDEWCKEHYGPLS